MDRLLGFVATLSLIAILIGLGPHRWWLCDLLANLRLHALAALLVLLPPLILARQRRLALAAAGAAAIALAVSASGPPTPPPLAAQAPAAGAGLHVLSYNLGPVLRNADDVSAYLRSARADVVVLQEYTFAWHDSLAALATVYPWAVTEPRAGPFGIAVYSRLPLTDTAVIDYTARRLPLIVATLRPGGAAVRLVGLHLEWPMTPAAFATRNEQLARVGALVAAAGLPLLVCGDWNLTPWSGWYRQLRSLGLDDGGWRARWQPTWPAALSLAGIPIDHCLATPAIRIATKRVGPALHSDHRPIGVRVTLHGADAEILPGPGA